MYILCCIAILLSTFKGGELEKGGIERIKSIFSIFLAENTVFLNHCEMTDFQKIEYRLFCIVVCMAHFK